VQIESQTKTWISDNINSGIKLFTWRYILKGHDNLAVPSWLADTSKFQLFWQTYIQNVAQPIRAWGLYSGHYLPRNRERIAIRLSVYGNLSRSNEDKKGQNQNYLQLTDRLSWISFFKVRAFFSAFNILSLLT
jgi:hypothetical protein